MTNTTTHFGLPLPSPNADSQRDDVARIAAAIEGFDALAGRVRAFDTDAAPGSLAAKLQFSGATVAILNLGGDEVMQVAIDAADTTALETNLMVIAMWQLIAAGWAAHGMVDGVVDEFTDATGLDAGLSDAVLTTGYVTSALVADATDGRGAYTYASSIHEGYVPNRVVDGVTDGTSRWIAAVADASAWWAVDLGTAKTISALRMISTPAVYGVKDFRLQWSANSSNGSDGAWTDVFAATHTSEAVWVDYPIPLTAARWWRVALDTKWAYFSITEVELRTAGTFTATSAAYAADGVPSSARLVLRHQPIGAVVLGTDLIVEASRDNGAHWTAATPVKQATVAGVDILSVTIPLSGQPVGQSMRWRVRTTGAEQRLHAISMQW
ncbi:MAG: discoidin domain-containing protein [Alphaproteobacteria bacterium]|nr:discoidin domain-containing protein [Alphaproteobacteria bacterium]